MGEKLHPYHERRREYLLEYAHKTVREFSEDTNYLYAADLLYKGEAIRARLVGLEDLANRYLVCALDCIERAFELGPKPHSTTMIDYWDDKELNYHWAKAHRSRYEIRLLIDGRTEQADLLGGMDRIERLFASTGALSNKVRTNRDTILYEYLWMAILAGEMDRAVERTKGILEVDDSRATPVRGFRRRESYVKMLRRVLRFARGDDGARTAAQKSLRTLLELHRDLEHEVENLYLPGPLFGFEWSWLWECVFEEVPSVSRAIDRLRVMVPDEGSAA